MKLFATAIVATIGAGWLALPSVELRLALRNSEHPSVVMLGDSHTDFVNWNILFRCSKVANFGVGGNTTAQMLDRLPGILALNPKLVIVMGGTNDALQGIAPETMAGNLRQMESLAKANNVRFVSLTPPPLAGHTIGVGDVSIPFTQDDLLKDQIHLRASGYAKWRDAIAPIVREYC